MTVRILIGDVRDKLAELPDESVHCVVTSPPYFGLRDYGTAQWDGGDPACDHTRQSAVSRASSGLDGATTTQGGTVAYGRVCGKCGATRIDNQIGLEPTLAEYIDTMTAVFRDVRRVLRSDGVCWLNIGDSYAGSTMSGGGKSSSTLVGTHHEDRAGARFSGTRDLHGLKPKDLMMVPARLALALQADGWWLRSDIIWAKPNPMPESVTDRPTNAHEHIFLLTKSARYWYDADAVREEFKTPDGMGWAKTIVTQDTMKVNGDNRQQKDRKGMGMVSMKPNPNGANLRNVWSISTVGYPGAHFATFPPEIPRRAIRAGTSEHGCCSACGAPWSRVVERTKQPRGDKFGARPTDETFDRGQAGSPYMQVVDVQTLGWQPGCTCDADVIPCTVMDPFGGSGTTGLVADQLGRDCILIELNPAYAAMAEKRIRDASPMFAEVQTA